MPEVIQIGKGKQDTRTLMYSIEPNGKVAIHKFPYGHNTEFGMLKLQKFVSRGFTFEDPTKTILYSKLPDGRVVVHKFALDANDERVQEFVERGFTFEDPRRMAGASGSATDAPLYISDKPPKAKKAREKVAKVS